MTSGPALWPRFHEGQLDTPTRQCFRWCEHIRWILFLLKERWLQFHEVVNPNNPSPRVCASVGVFALTCASCPGDGYSGRWISGDIDTSTSSTQTAVAERMRGMRNSSSAPVIRTFDAKAASEADAGLLVRRRDKRTRLSTEKVSQKTRASHKERPLTAHERIRLRSDVRDICFCAASPTLPCTLRVYSGPPDSSQQRRRAVLVQESRTAEFANRRRRERVRRGVRQRGLWMEAPQTRWEERARHGWSWRGELDITWNGRSALCEEHWRRLAFLGGQRALSYLSNGVCDTLPRAFHPHRWPARRSPSRTAHPAAAAPTMVKVVSAAKSTASALVVTGVVMRALTAVTAAADEEAAATWKPYRHRPARMRRPMSGVT